MRNNRCIYPTCNSPPIICANVTWRVRFLRIRRPFCLIPLPFQDVPYLWQSIIFEKKHEHGEHMWISPPIPCCLRFMISSFNPFSSWKLVLCDNSKRLKTKNVACIGATHHPRFVQAPPVFLGTFFRVTLVLSLLRPHMSAHCLAAL